VNNNQLGALHFINAPYKIHDRTGCLTTPPERLQKILTKR